MDNKTNSLTIDVFRCDFSGDQVVFIWNGWSIYPKLGQLKLQASINGKQTGKMKTTFRQRPDVAEHYPQFKAEAMHGFELSCFLPWKSISVDDKLELLLTENGQTKVIWALKDKSLEELFENKTFLCNIDSMRIADKAIAVSGWCLSMLNEKPEMHLFASDGEELPITIKTIDRPDVSMTFLEDDSQKDAGFVFSFPFSETERYKLVFQNSLQKEQFRIEPKKVYKETCKDEKRRFILPFRQIIEQTDKKQIKKDGKLFLKKGLKALRREWIRRYIKPSYLYERWFEKNKATKRELKRQRRSRFDYSPKISIVVPAYQTPELFLKQMVSSVQEQTYRNWELCIADGGVDDTTVETVMKEYCSKDSRIRYQKLDENLGISGNSNAALALAQGDYVALLDHDDILTPDALYEVVKAINDEKADVIYSDEDKISMDLQHLFDPHFKTDLNMGLLRSDNYICHLFVAKREYFERIGGFHLDFDGSQDYDLILRCVEIAENVYHIPKILYHWRMHQNSTAANPESKMYCYEAGVHAIEAHLNRMGLSGHVEMTEHYGHYRITYPASQSDFLTVFLLQNGDKQMEEDTIKSINLFSGNLKHEIISITPDETTYENPCIALNEKISQAKGDFILILEAGMELLSTESLLEWMGECESKDVAAVGVKVCDAYKRVLSCGQVFTKSGQLHPMFVGYLKEAPGYFARAKVRQDISVLSLSGVMLRKKYVVNVGGWNTELPRNLADADLCFKLRQAGKRIVLDPGIELRGTKKNTMVTPATAAQQNAFVSAWRDVLKASDPYYSPNFDSTNGDFRIRIL